MTHEGTQPGHHGFASDLGSENVAADTAGKKAMQPQPSDADQRAAAPQPAVGGLGETDMEPGSPYGAGDSVNQRGEDLARKHDRPDRGRADAAGWPSGPK